MLKIYFMWTMLTEKSETTINWMDCEMRTQASSQNVFYWCPWLLNQTSLINVFVYEVEFLWIHFFRFAKTHFPAFLPQFFLKKLQADTQDVSDLVLFVKAVVKMGISATPYLIYSRVRKERRGRGREKRQQVNEYWVLNEAKTQQFWQIMKKLLGWEKERM